MSINSATQNNNPGNRPARVRIGELLITKGFITEEDLATALVEAKKSNQFVGQVLIRQGKLTREQLGSALSEQFNTKYVSLSKIEIDLPLLDILPEEFMRLKRVIPIGREAGRLVVAMIDPSDRSVIDEITFITGMRPQAVITTQIEFQETYNKYLSKIGRAHV